MNRTIILRAVVGALALSAFLLIGSDTQAIPFFHVVGDTDGDHLVATDLQPSVYCATGHANANADTVINTTDIVAAAHQIGVYPSAFPLRDQNHNDVQDIMDVALVMSLFGNAISTACAETIPSPLPETGSGSTSGPGLMLVAPSTVTGGSVTARVATAATSPNPFNAFWATLTFDASIVQATSATAMGSIDYFCPPYLIDNVPDGLGNGTISFGCVDQIPGASSAQDLANFVFNVVAPGDPKFCIQPFSDPYAVPAAVHSTYTVGSDFAPQAQAIIACGAAVESGPVIGVDPDGTPLLIRDPGVVTATQTSITFDAPLAGEIQATTTGPGANCSSAVPPLGTPVTLSVVGPDTFTYSARLPVSNSCTGAVTTCFYLESSPATWVLLGCSSPFRLIDPSGDIYPLANPAARIEGATVTLERFDGSTFVPMNPDLDIDDFTPLINPQSSNSLGRYAWDVAPGTYRVVVSKAGCTTATSPSVVIPPPVTTLDVGLACADTEPDGFDDLQATSHNGAANALTYLDNCPGVANPLQTNTDGNYINLAPDKGYNDHTLPNSDASGDACDTDADNDGRSDADELAGAGGCAATNRLLRDTDGDRFLDGAECALGTSPVDVNSRPGDGGPITLAACGATTDADGDGVTTQREVCFYNTDPAVANTDGDTCADGKEVASINANLAVDAIDLGQVAQAFGVYAYGDPAFKYNFDITKDGNINAIDLGQVAQRFGAC